MMKDEDFKLLRGFADKQTNKQTNRQTFVIVELLLRLKIHSKSPWKPVESLQTLSHGYLINHNAIKQTIIYSSVKLQIGLQLLQPNCYRIFRSLILLLTFFIFTHFRWIQAEWCGQNRVSFWHVDGSYSNMQGTTLPQIAAIFQLFVRGQDPLKKDLKFWCQSCWSRKPTVHFLAI